MSRVALAEIAVRKSPKQNGRMIWVVLYVATIFVANWAVAAFGVVSVGSGLMAPQACTSRGWPSLSGT